MKSLFCTSANVFWEFNDDGNVSPIVEVVLSLLEKQVTVGPGGLAETTNYETVRFGVTGDGMTTLIRNLELIRDQMDATIGLVKPRKPVKKVQK